MLAQATIAHGCESGSFSINWDKQKGYHNVPMVRERCPSLTFHLGYSEGNTRILKSIRICVLWERHSTYSPIKLQIITSRKF